MMMRRAAILACLLALSAPGGGAIASAASAAPGGEVFDAGTVAFLTKVDAWALDSLGVQMPGRIAIFETLAAEQLDQSYGDDGVDGIPAAAAYLELYFRSGEYVDKPVLYIRERNMRAYLAGHIPASLREQFDRTHRIAPVLLLDERRGCCCFAQAGPIGTTTPAPPGLAAFATRWPDCRSGRSSAWPSTG